VSESFVNKSISGKTENSRIILLNSILIFIILITGCSRKNSPGVNAVDTNGVKVIVLDDCGASNSPSEQIKTDEVLMLDSDCKLIRKIDGFKVKSNFGENRVISVSPDNRFFVVCEDIINKLSIYETSTGKEYWSQTWPDRAVNSAAFLGNKLFAIGINFIMSIDTDELGKKNIEEISKFWNGSWLDIAYDKKNKCIWAVGLSIRKYDLNFDTIFEIGSIIDRTVSGAFSVDVASDGSAWVVVRDESRKDTREHKLLKISPDGEIVKTIVFDVMPYCVCVDDSDDSVWVTGMGSIKDYSKIGDEWPETLSELNDTARTEIQIYTHKYDSEGNKILELDNGGYSMVLDKSDKSVWIACYESIVHYSGTGNIINEYKDVSKQHKWIALISEGEK